MRYSKWALWLFGAGLVLGLVLVSANLSGIGLVASVAMAAALVLLPFALVRDWWHYRPWNDLTPKRKSTPARTRAAAAKRRSPSKSSPPRTPRTKGKR